MNKSQIARDWSVSRPTVINLFREPALKPERPFEIEELQAFGLLEQPLTPDEALARRERRDVVYRLLLTLSAQEDRVVRRRILDDWDGTAVGLELGITNARVTQLQDRGMRRLRHPSRTRRLDL